MAHAERDPRKLRGAIVHFAESTVSEANLSLTTNASRPEGVSILTDDKIAHAAELLSNAKRVVALTGAGISTPSGIPDFRSPGSGLWEKVDPFVVASIEGFLRNPQAFYDWLKPLARLSIHAQPNPAHYALADLEARGKLRAVITQNVDDLHQRAGSRRVLPVHGDMRGVTCTKCHHPSDARPILEQWLANGAVPKCAVCGGVLKPDVILFGEMLPINVMLAAEAESKTCDVMLVAGSSLEVTPACDLPLVVAKRGAQLIIVNRTPTYADRHAAVVLNEDVAMVLPKIVGRVRQDRPATDAQ